MAENAHEKKVHLKFPVELDGAKIKTVTIRRSKVKDHRKARLTAGDNPAEYELHLFASLTGLPLDFFDELDFIDYTAIQEAFNDFLSLEDTEKLDKPS